MSVATGKSLLELADHTHAVYDCDWARGHINKVAWAGTEETWPAAYEFLRAYELRNEDQIPMMKAIDQDGQDLDGVVAGWVDDNQSIWQPWVDVATN